MLKLQKRQNEKMYLLTGKPEANLSLEMSLPFCFVLVFSVILRYEFLGNGSGPWH